MTKTHENLRAIYFYKINSHFVHLKLRNMVTINLNIGGDSRNFTTSFLFATHSQEDYA